MIQAWLSGIEKYNIKGDKEYGRDGGQREASGRRGKERGERRLNRRRKEEREKRKRREREWKKSRSLPVLTWNKGLRGSESHLGASISGGGP